MRHLGCLPVVVERYAGGWISKHIVGLVPQYYLLIAVPIFPPQIPKEMKDAVSAAGKILTPCFKLFHNLSAFHIIYPLI